MVRWLWAFACRMTFAAAFAVLTVSSAAIGVKYPVPVVLAGAGGVVVERASLLGGDVRLLAWHRQNREA